MRRTWLALAGITVCAGAGFGLSRAQATPSAAPKAASVSVVDEALVRGIRIVGQVPEAVRSLISAQIGALSNTIALVTDREQLLAGMMSRGYLEAQVQLTRDNDDTGGMFVKFAVQAGPLYRISDVSARGSAVDIGALTTLSIDDIADADRIERNRMMIEQALTRRSGKRAMVTTNLQVDRSNHAVAVTYRIAPQKSNSK
jgi:outer membrane protein assembly factor BamA